MNNEPLISCLCVTRSRVHLLKRTIRSFNDQTYPNRELVIVYESDDRETGEFLYGVTDNNIVVVEAQSSPALSLGELRNLSVRECKGEYFCQWDDDDFYHIERISFQMDVIRQSKMPACVMMSWLIFNAGSKQAYVSCMRPWEGSLLCRKSIFGVELRYEDIGTGEDTPIINKLFSRSLAFPIIMPKLYIYVYHGSNVWEMEHWERIFAASRKLSCESSTIIGDILEGRYTGEEASQLLDSIEE